MSVSKKPSLRTEINYALMLQALTILGGIIFAAGVVMTTQRAQEATVVELKASVAGLKDQVTTVDKRLITVETGVQYLVREKQDKQAMLMP
jgi:hypothetical protein